MEELEHLIIEPLEGYPQAIGDALWRLQEEFELRSLRQSADLYAEVYEEDTDLQELTEAALSEWPE